MVKDMVKDMLAQQKELNSYIHKEWDKQDFDWKTAILVEAVEGQSSLPWKWWKSGDTDLFNLRVEITDVWFFLMSDLMTDWEDETIINYSNLLDEVPKVDEVNPDEVSENIKGFLLELLRGEDIYDILREFSNLLSSVGMDLEDLYKSYNTKNVLNKFRQDNGYKDGSYIKIWNGLEDNVVAYDFASTIEANEDFKDTLQDMLNDFYVSNVKEVKQSTKIINGKRVTK